MYHLSFLKVTLDFSISALNFLRFSFLLANKRSGTEVDMEVTNLQKYNIFLIIILKLSWKSHLYLKVTVDCSYFTFPYLVTVFFLVCSLITGY